MVRFGRYDCWPLFATLCGKTLPAFALWDMVFVNLDTFQHLEQFGSNSLRPPLYGWFAWTANLFLVTPHNLIKEASNLIAFTADPQANAAYLKVNPQPHLLRIAQAQQIVLWSAAIFFVWCASRVVPALAVAAIILALYDGGVLTQGYFAHAVEAKMLYLAAFFIASAATLLVVVRPSRRNLLLVAISCAALPLIRPQGLIAGLLVGFACFRFLWALPRISGRAVRATAGSLAIFIGAATLPSVVTFIGQGVLQPSNIYALSRVGFALEFATPADAARLSDEFKKTYLTKMLAKRDSGKPADINDSMRRNQGLAVDACFDLDPKQKQGVLCGNAMKQISDAVLDRHYSDYLHKFVLPGLVTLMHIHIGGSVAYLPTSMALSVALVVVLCFMAPWLALWGATILAIHLSLVLLLATLAGPYSEYFITTEPVLLSAMAVMLAFTIQKFARHGIESRAAPDYSQFMAVGIERRPTDYHDAAHERRKEVSSTYRDDPLKTEEPGLDTQPRGTTPGPIGQFAAKVLETEEPELNKQPRATTLGPIGQFTAKVAIVVAAIVIGTLFVVNAISEQIQTAANSFHVGGRQFWSKLGQELERQAGPDTDLSPEQRERVIRNLRVIVQRWRPFIDVLREESQSPPQQQNGTKRDTSERPKP